MGHAKRLFQGEDLVILPGHGHNSKREAQPIRKKGLGLRETEERALATSR